MGNLALKYSQKSTPKKSMFHSSGLASAKSNSSMGATSTQSFSARQHTEKNRSFIGKYGSSQIASGHTGKTSRDSCPKMENAKTSGSSLTSKYKTWYNSGDSGGISSDG